MKKQSNLLLIGGIIALVIVIVLLKGGLLTVMLPGQSTTNSYTFKGILVDTTFFPGEGLVNYILPVVDPYGSKVRIITSYMALSSSMSYLTTAYRYRTNYDWSAGNLTSTDTLYAKPQNIIKFTGLNVMTNQITRIDFDTDLTMNTFKASSASATCQPKLIMGLMSGTTYNPIASYDFTSSCGTSNCTASFTDFYMTFDGTNYKFASTTGGISGTIAKSSLSSVVQSSGVPYFNFSTKDGCTPRASGYDLRDYMWEFYILGITYSTAKPACTYDCCLASDPVYSEKVCGYSYQECSNHACVAKACTCSCCLGGTYAFKACSPSNYICSSNCGTCSPPAANPCPTYYACCVGSTTFQAKACTPSTYTCTADNVCTPPPCTLGAGQYMAQQTFGAGAVITTASLQGFAAYCTQLVTEVLDATTHTVTNDYTITASLQSGNIITVPLNKAYNIKWIINNPNAACTSGQTWTVGPNICLNTGIVTYCSDVSCVQTIVQQCTQDSDCSVPCNGMTATCSANKCGYSGVCVAMGQPMPQTNVNLWDLIQDTWSTFWDWVKNLVGGGVYVPPVIGIPGIDATKIIEYFSYDTDMTGSKMLTSAANHGASLVTNASCKLGGCYLFEKQNSDYIDYSGQPLLTSLRDHSVGAVSFWVYVFSKGTTSDFIYGLGQDDRTDLQEIFYSWYGSEELTFRQYNDNTVKEDKTNPMSVGAWHFITMGTDDTDLICTIDNGADQCSSTMPATWWWSDFETIPSFTMGKTLNVGEYMGGYIDEFTLWSGGLNATERTALYNDGDGVSLKGIIQ